MDDMDIRLLPDEDLLAEITYHSDDYINERHGTAEHYERIKAEILDRMGSEAL